MEIIDVSLSKQVQGLNFVVAARAVESMRYALKYLSVEENKIIATDGRRLHIFELQHKWPLGLYDCVLATNQRVVLIPAPKDCNKFPKWKDIVPEYKNFFGITISDEPTQEIARILGTLGKKDVFIDSAYLAPIVSLRDIYFKVYFDREDRPVYFVNNQFKAIVMPIKVSIEYQKD